MKCKQCGLPLSKQTFAICIPNKNDENDLVGQNWWFGRIEEIISVYILEEIEFKSVRVWAGDCGHEGDNSFCSIECGYEYGLQSLSRLRNNVTKSED